jgi:hypothetical protein
MHRRLPNKGKIKEEANGLHSTTANPPEEARPVYKGLGRRLSPSATFPFFHFLSINF